MNTEQYRQLKPGDNVLVYGVVERVGEENVQVGVKHSNGDKSCAWVSKEDVGAAWAVPSKPKYDPCRLFKKGDKVRVVEGLEPCFFHDEDEWEQLPYYTIYFGIKRNYELVSRLDKKYYTREQAEAERARLNAEYRKEQK